MFYRWVVKEGALPPTDTSGLWVAKELDGVIYVGLVSAVGGGFPIVEGWSPIGPGTSPIVVRERGHCLITFDYLGHTYARRMDTSIWPPQVVDPVTYAPNISIQEPHEAIGLQGKTSMGAAEFFEVEQVSAGGMQVLSNIFYDDATGDMSVQVGPIAADPIPTTRRAWRLYVREIGASEWTLHQDWVASLAASYTFERNGSLRLQFAVTYGCLWTPESRNSSGFSSLRESPLSPILTVDSNTASWTYSRSGSDTVESPEGEVGAIFLEGACLFHGSTGAEIVEVGGNTTMGSVLMVFDVSEKFHDTGSAETTSFPTGQQTMGTALLYS